MERLPFGSIISLRKGTLQTNGGMSMCIPSYFTIFPQSRLLLLSNRLELCADLEQPETVAKGVLVKHAAFPPSKSFLVHRVDARRCVFVLLDASGNLLHDQFSINLKPLGGRISLMVKHLNQQGGGLLICLEPKFGIPNTLLTMEWLDPLVETGLLQMNDIDVFGMINPSPELQVARGKVLLDLKAEARRQSSASPSAGGFCLDSIGRALYQPLVTARVRDPKLMCELLLQLPFILHPRLLSPLLASMTRADAKTVKAWLETSMQVSNDFMWTSQCRWVTLLGVGIARGDEGQTLQKQITFSMFKFLIGMSKWFEMHKEYPAAVWCLEQNLTQCSAHRLGDYVARILDIMSQLHNKFQNVAEAFACSEQAILTRRTDKRMATAKGLRQVAQQLIGTSGRMIPWDNMATTPKPVCCANCCVDNAKEFCRSCGLVFYCSPACQKKNWTEIHSQTCLMCIKG